MIVTKESDLTTKTHSQSFCSETKTNITLDCLASNYGQFTKRKAKFHLKRKLSKSQEKDLSLSLKKEKKEERQIKKKQLNKTGEYNNGRWKPEEHKRFVEAIIKYGNEWKEVQKHVGTRSSTQARSHAQKFFVKIKRSNLLELNIDFSTNSIKMLHEIANNMDSDKYVSAIKALNCIAFEKQSEIIKDKKLKKKSIPLNKE